MRIEWKKYIQLMNERPYSFVDDGNIHIVKDEKIIKKYEREHNKVIGVVYESEYNIMVVDLVYEIEGEYYAYERILPAVEQGAVVILPFYNGKLVMLHQYRHALRQYQYAIPRGFAEKNVSSIDNVKKEICEELGADVISYEYCGKIAPDSGMTSRSVDVYSCEISNYETKSQHEGISRTIELSEDEMAQWILEGKITDGFTLAAYCLWCKRIH